MKIAVLGGGNGAHAFSADLTLGGNEVHMCELPQFKHNIDPIIEQNNEIEITGVARTGVAKIAKVTTDIKEAIEGVELINIPIPAFGQENFYKAMAPHLEDGQIIVTHPGNYGALRLSHMLKNMGIKKKVTIADASTLVYTCRRFGPAKVRVNGFKKNVKIAALPATDTSKVLEVMDKIIPGRFVPGTNVLEIALENGNAQFHTPIMTLNTGRIEDTKGEFLFYIEGATPSVAHIVQVLSDENIAVGNALGLDIMDPKDSLREMYGAHGETMYEAFQDTKPYHDRVCESAPSRMDNRYISEDTPYGLVPLTSIGELIGIPTPISNLFIDLASLINQTDYRETGLKVDELGLAGLNKEEIIKKVT